MQANKYLDYVRAQDSAEQRFKFSLCYQGTGVSTQTLWEVPRLWIEVELGGSYVSIQL